MDAKTPKEMEIQEINRALMHALYRGFMDGVAVEEMAIRLVIIGKYDAGTKIEFSYGIVGIVEDTHHLKDKDISRVLVNCCHFRDIYKSLTPQQQWDEVPEVA